MNQIVLFKLQILSRSFQFYPMGKCFFPLSLSIILQIFKAGPSFNPKYFIIISEVSSNNAFPGKFKLFNAI